MWLVQKNLPDCLDVSGFHECPGPQEPSSLVLTMRRERVAGGYVIYRDDDAIVENVYFAKGLMGEKQPDNFFLVLKPTWDQSLIG